MLCTNMLTAITISLRKVIIACNLDRSLAGRRRGGEISDEISLICIQSAFASICMISGAETEPNRASCTLEVIKAAHARRRQTNFADTRAMRSIFHSGNRLRVTLKCLDLNLGSAIVLRSIVFDAPPPLYACLPLSRRRWRTWKTIN